MGERRIKTARSLNSIISFHFFSLEWKEWRNDENWRALGCPNANKEKEIKINLFFLDCLRREDSGIDWIALCGLLVGYGRCAAAQCSATKGDKPKEQSNSRIHLACSLPLSLCGLWASREANAPHKKRQAGREEQALFCFFKERLINSLVFFHFFSWSECCCVSAMKKRGRKAKERR